ncbi:MAG: hypothetical protein HZC54_11105 [Verrucomicrobia bacterium]|nr:hypothetical protein [Verrucomicrobiota bacterium]
MCCAIGLWFTCPKYSCELMASAMCCDYSWKHPGQDYLNVYDPVRQKQDCRVTLLVA